MEIGFLTINLELAVKHRYEVRSIEEGREKKLGASVFESVAARYCDRLAQDLCVRDEKPILVFVFDLKKQKRIHERQYYPSLEIVPTRIK